MARLKYTVATKIFDFLILTPLRVIPPKKSIGSLSFLIRARWAEILAKKGLKKVEKMQNWGANFLGTGTCYRKKLFCIGLAMKKTLYSTWSHNSYRPV